MRYQVVVAREGNRWLADVPALEGSHTWARNLPALDAAVREVIVLAEDLPDDAMPGLEISYVYATGDKTVDVAAPRTRGYRAKVTDMRRQAVEDTERLARDLVSAGYSVRDAAVLTGVSYQRVSQLTRKAS